MAKVTVVTGGTKGLGYAIAKIFAASGSDLLLTYRSDQTTADDAKKTLEDAGVRCELLALDQTSPESMDLLFKRCHEIWGQVDHVIFNAAATAFKDLQEIEYKHFQKTFDMVVWGFLSGVKAAVPLMPNGGSIVSISGMDTVKVVPRHGLLAAAKAGLEQLTTYFAHELGPKNIRVNSVNPGFLETESTQIYLGKAFDAVAKGYAQGCVTKKPARLEDVAEIVRFLCSPESSWVVGQTIIADGGYNKSLLQPMG